MTLTTVQPATLTDSHMLNLIPWADDRNDLFGHDPRSAYVEQFWLGTLGPSTTWFLRRCTSLLDGTDGASVNLEETASALGIGHQGGASSAMAKTIDRACRFRAARTVGSATLAVRLRLPQLSHRQLQRMPRPMRHRHEEFITSKLHNDEISRQRFRARRLALSLVECGDDPGETELHLGRLQFHPAIASDAVRWAWSQHHGRVSQGEVSYDPPDAA